MSRSPSVVWSLAASAAFVGVVLAVLFHLDAQDVVLQLLAWIDGQGALGPLLFVLVMALVVVLLAPGVPFTTGAGFVFGVVAGSLYVVVGTTLGAALSFLIARHLLGARAARFIQRRGRLRVVDEALTAHGWKVVLLTRLVPFFPFKLSNYLFGLTGLSLRGFMGGTFIGVIPLSVHNVYLGAIVAEVATGGERQGAWTPAQWVLYGAGFFVALGTVVYLSRLARRALANGVEAEEGVETESRCPR
jgi:uncharacterized membrane protein YdjX (TVP38/TMEM64 family)